MTSLPNRIHTLHLSDTDLSDILQGLAMRLDALRDARPGFRCPARTQCDITTERIASLAANLDYVRTSRRTTPVSAAEACAQACKHIKEP